MKLRPAMLAILACAAPVAPYAQPVTGHYIGIAEAAQNAGHVQATRNEVAGHADGSGSPQCNQRLSLRRADAVAAELMAHGISLNEITVSAYGESRPLVPTADGVREPQNRRVEIVLR